jgi:hypothetical protein
MVSELLLDYQIRDWVFIPILYIMFVMGLLKSSISQLMNSGRKDAPKVTTMDALKSNSKNLQIGHSKIF